MAGFYGIECPENFKYCDATIGSIITDLIPFLYTIAAMIALLFLIWGGIRYMTARGDPKAIDAARSTVTSAAIGLLIILLVGVIYALMAAVFKIEVFGFVPGAYAQGVNIGDVVKLNDKGLTIGDAFGSFGELITAIVRFALAAAALIFFFMLIWGGFRYINAGGDPKNADAARSTLTNAGIGLLIVVASFVIIEIITRAVGAASIFG